MTPSEIAGLAACPVLGAAAAWVAARLAGQPLKPGITAAAGTALPALGLWAVAILPPPWWPASLLLAWALVVLALVDMADLRLPDAVTLPLSAAGLLLSLPGGQWADHCAGAALGWGVLTALAAGYRRWRRRDGLGQGDAKLLAAAGAWLGWQALPGVVLTACAAAILVMAVIHIRSGRFTPQMPLPFGPPLCAGFWLVWLYGPLGG